MGRRVCNVKDKEETAQLLRLLYLNCHIFANEILIIIMLLNNSDAVSSFY